MAFILGKIVKRPRAEELLENGTVFMRRLGAYRDMNCKVVGDPNEGLMAHYSGKNPSLKATIQIGDETLPFPFVTMRMNSSAQRHAVYCMSAIEIPAVGAASVVGVLTPFLCDKRLLKLGDTLVLFRDTNEFVERLNVAAEAAGHPLDVTAGPVEYVPHDYCGETGPFTKIGDYAYQQEFRFITDKPIPGDSITLSLGNLSDIATWVDIPKFQAVVAA